ncbi:MAG: hypothetical protein C0602_00660 [Denitrovibrio sp.]|nr:MAG: hypothetical protein C0602_00660 [Denitrovibrio sp.]
MKTITIVSKDYTGLVADITELLTANRIYISSITAEKVGADALIRLLTEQYENAIRVLNEADFHAVGEGAVLVRVVNKPGTLAAISRKLAENSVDIKGINMIQQNEGYNVLAITSDVDDDVREILGDILIN